MGNSTVVKIQTYCPKDAADRVRLAIGKAGGGQLGNYHYCAFVSEGKGYFLPMEGARPAIGEIGKIEEVKEVKIEFVCEKEKINDVMQAIKDAHPYEEVPIEVFPLVSITKES